MVAACWTFIDMYILTYHKTYTRGDYIYNLQTNKTFC